MLLVHNSPGDSSAAELYTVFAKKLRENYQLSIKIELVSTKSDLNTFIKLPWALYRDDKNWVPPLIFDRKQQLAPKHPYFKHAEWQGFLAWKDGRPVGRISAQIDRLEADMGRGDLGHFGLIEGIDDPETFRLLLAAAEGWLKERGKTRILGPFNMNINQELGVLVDGFDTPAYFMMAHSLPYYGAHIEAAGYHVAKQLLAYQIKPDFEVPKIMTGIVRRLAKRLRVRPLDPARKAEDLDICCDIFNDAWANNWSFLPFTHEEFQTIGREMLLIIQPEFIQIAEVDGEPAAFVVLLPNVNEAIADLNGRLLPFGWAKLLWRLKVRYPASGRVPLMGVRQKFHHTPLGPGLAMSVMDAVRRIALVKGMTDAEMSWILEDNAGMRNIIETIGGRISKRYNMYEKSLVAPGG